MLEKQKKKPQNKKNPSNSQINKEPEIPYSLASEYGISICAKLNAVKRTYQDMVVLIPFFYTLQIKRADLEPEILSSTEETELFYNRGI